MFLSIYRVYIIEIYKGKKGAGQKVKNVREKVFLFLTASFSALNVSVLMIILLK